MVRTHHLPLPVETAPGLRGCGQGLVLSGSSGVRLRPALVEGLRLVPENTRRSFCARLPVPRQPGTQAFEECRWPIPLRAPTAHMVSPRGMLQVIYGRLRDSSAWPTFGTVDLHYDRHLGVADA